MRQIFLDTETTGLKPGQIGQISFIAVEDNGQIWAYNQFFEVDTMTVGASRATNRDIEFYKKASGGQKFKDKINEIAYYLNGSILIAQNENFDEKFLAAEFIRAGVQLELGNRFDCMTYFKDILRLNRKGRNQSDFKYPNLTELAYYTKLDMDKVNEYSKVVFTGDNQGFHDARFDSVTLFLIYQVYFEKYYKTGNMWANAFCR